MSPCIDKPLFNNVSFIPGVSPLSAIAETKTLWPPGSILTVYFIDGTEEQQALCESAMDEWESHCNLYFDVVDDPKAIIRISFKFGQGAWSYVGLGNLNIPFHMATMNLGFKSTGVELHEFGHAIGLSHEHQNPKGGIEWNEDVVIEALSGAPNNWDLATIRANVLDNKLLNTINNNVFDPDSIMLYPFPASWTKNGVGTKSNSVLSLGDVSTVNKLYPFETKIEIEPETIDDIPTKIEPVEPIVPLEPIGPKTNPPIPEEPDEDSGIGYYITLISVVIAVIGFIISKV